LKRAVFLLPGILALACDPPILIFGKSTVLPPPTPHCRSIDFSRASFRGRNFGSSAIWGTGGVAHAIVRGMSAAWLDIDVEGNVSENFVAPTFDFETLDALELGQTIWVSGGGDGSPGNEGALVRMDPENGLVRFPTGGDVLFALAAAPQGVGAPVLYAAASSQSSGKLFRVEDGTLTELGGRPCPGSAPCIVRGPAAAVDGHGWAYLNPPNPGDCPRCLLVVPPTAGSSTISLELPLIGDEVNAMTRIQDGRVVAGTLYGELLFLLDGEVVDRRQTALGALPTTGMEPCGPDLATRKSVQALTAFDDGILIANCGAVTQWWPGVEDCPASLIPESAKDDLKVRRIHRFAADKVALTGIGGTVLLTIGP
jgi:hypothetical protein